MNRRDILNAAPAVLAVATLPAEAATETPVMALFREWIAAAIDSANFSDSNPAADWDDPVSMAFMDRQMDIEHRMFAAPKRDLIDLVLTVAAVTDFGMFGITDGKLWAEARALIGGAA